jgi:hypothetical protein
MVCAVQMPQRSGLGKAGKIKHVIRKAEDEAITNLSSRLLFKQTSHKRI